MHERSISYYYNNLRVAINLGKYQNYYNLQNTKKTESLCGEEQKIDQIYDFFFIAKIQKLL